MKEKGCLVQWGGGAGVGRGGCLPEGHTWAGLGLLLSCSLGPARARSRAGINGIPEDLKRRAQEVVTFEAMGSREGGSYREIRWPDMWT